MNWRCNEHYYYLNQTKPMKFFIDTANLEDIKEAQALGVLDGVTTNPSLMAKEGITGKANILKHYLDICTYCRWRCFGRSNFY